MDIAIQIIMAGLQAIAAVAPSVAAAITGGQSVDEASKAAHEAHRALLERSAPWAADVAARKERG